MIKNRNCVDYLVPKYVTENMCEIGHKSDKQTIRIV